MNNNNLGGPVVGHEKMRRIQVGPGSYHCAARKSANDVSSDEKEDDPPLLRLPVDVIRMLSESPIASWVLLPIGVFPQSFASLHLTATTSS